MNSLVPIITEGGQLTVCQAWIRGHGLEPAERVHQAAVLAGAVQRHPHAKPAVPALNRVDGVLEH